MEIENMEVYSEDGGWMIKTDNPRVKELFGTDCLPTPFLVGTPVEDVVAVLKRLNPDANVTVRRK